MNKEDFLKAEKIAESKYHYDVNLDNCEHYDCYVSAIEMAIWKERQMIRKACYWLENNVRTNDIEKFIKAMKE